MGRLSKVTLRWDSSELRLKARIVFARLECEAARDSRSFFSMTTPLKEGMKPDLIVVGNEISHLWFHHDVFWKIADAFNGSERVQASGGHLINWFKNCYIEAG